MPHYFFDVQDGVAYPDLVGATFRTLAEARGEAVRRSVAVLADDSKQHCAGETWTIKIKNDWGLTLFTLHFCSDQPVDPASPVRTQLEQGVDRYRRRAAEMAQMATRGATEAIRTEHRELEKLWLEMAETTQRQERAKADAAVKA
jgi:hypothetical protein